MVHPVRFCLARGQFSVQLGWLHGKTLARWMINQKKLRVLRNDGATMTEISKRRGGSRGPCWVSESSAFGRWGACRETLDGPIYLVIPLNCFDFQGKKIQKMRPIMHFGFDAKKVCGLQMWLVSFSAPNHGLFRFSAPFPADLIWCFPPSFPPSVRMGLEAASIRMLPMPMQWWRLHFVSRIRAKNLSIQGDKREEFLAGFLSTNCIFVISSPMLV